MTGLGILGASTGFAMWARGVLGSSWSIGPQVGGDRRLRTRGPYAITRHPIYTGVLGMLVGTAIAVGGGVALVLIGVGLVALETKIRMEEPLLVAQFPNEYPAYRARVPQLIPGLRRRRSRGGDAGG
jgi:protein-S-isoprenylcysteine O-methyltransferase Ste14